MQSSSAIKQNTFADDIRRGLSAAPKFLSSKYFYDDEGSRLFQEIMKLPEYYLTQAEFEIFSTQTGEIFRAFTTANETFDLIELGAGDGSKTSLLVDYFLKQTADFTYVPIDISGEALSFLTEKFKAQFPGLSIQTEQGDYFQTLETFRSKSNKRKIILFLGSNIGNFGKEQAQNFFRQLRAVMNSTDLLFIGFDLQKDPRVILCAYDDMQNITAKFNLNLLTRINRELGANFNLENFSHYASYHPIEGAARSFLISRKAQTVFVESLNKTFDFAAWEPIFMEISQKYSLAMIEDLAQTSGFEVSQYFFDSQKFYTNSLWKPI
ncbi:MAG: L-histidine N(alpha)-methyltransferase [Acidobacteria bacterium]|jgi:dimethylhistidine N-methyltransferase|nr:L-histidine N(alpha)-methyltransferase [Acidobacteriota bacterium]